MLIAQELRKTNIAEYILYMWQVEDLLRACSFDAGLIESKLVNRFNADEKTAREIAAWYNNLSLVMEKEHIREKGHLQVIANLVSDLNEFHLKLIETQKDEVYLKLYHMNQDIISEFIQKNGLSTADAEKIFGLTQSRITSLMNGEINLFMLSILEKMGLKVGISY